MSTPKERLQELRDLRDQALISAEQYSAAVNAVLSKLSSGENAQGPHAATPHPSGGVLSAATLVPEAAQVDILSPGDELGQFRIVRTLGVGGFSVVYEAEHKLLGHKRALKVVVAQASTTGSAVKQLLFEWKQNQGIRDWTHVIKADAPEAHEVRGMRLIVMPMELAEGGDFRRWLIDHPDLGARRDEGVRLWREACVGVAAIHATGLVHRDLKPENLLLCGESLKVTDLGLAHSRTATLAAATRTLNADGVGTPAYMAKEQFLSAHPDDVDGRADLWALGVILFEIVTGRTPFGGAHHELRNKVLDDRVAINFSRVPEDMRPLLESLLARDPARRPASVGAALALDSGSAKVEPTTSAALRGAKEQTSPPAEARFRMLNEIADVWNDQDKNPGKAIEALEEARELQPLNPGLLHKLIALYQATENWPKMIDTLQAIADHEPDPERRARFLYTMAQLYRDKEGDQDKAVELFSEALDLNPAYVEAFERINKLLTGKKDWKALERAFRKMLRRMSTANIANPDLEFNLWHNLGLIYRDRLKDLTSAIESFKMATRFKPDEAVERQILAELYEATDQTEAAVGEHALVLQKDPLRVDPYRSLYQLYLRMHEYDRAWCMCAALAFLRKTDEEEQRFFEDYRPRGMIQVKSRLDNEAWVKNLFHKDENVYIGKIFEMLTPAAIVAKTNQLKEKKQLPVLDRRFREDPATSTVTFAKTFGWAAQVLGVTMPELYVRNDVPGALMAVPAIPPASVAGQTVLTGFTPQELTFIVGKHLSSYRGEHYIKNLFPTLNELKVILFAGVKLVMGDFTVPGEMAQAVNSTATELVKHMQPVQRESLRIVVQKWMEDGAKADLKRWMQAIEITASRAGLLLCADLEIAKKIIAAEPQLPGDLPAAEKMKELLVFSVSEQYFGLRKSLGIAVG